MYAIIFDIDYQNTDTNAISYHKDIRKFMESNHFTWKQGGVYFGNENVNAVDCVLVIQKLAKTFTWFSACVKDVRMLRIEENTDLLPVI